MSPRVKHPEEGMVYACPECGAATPYRRVKDNTYVGDGSEYACYVCHAGFDEPVERATRQHQHGKGGSSPEGFGDERE